MSKHLSTTTTEPALTIGAVTSLVAAILGLLVAFGVQVTAEQRDAILAVVVAIAVVAPFVASVLIRRKVTATTQIVAQLDRHTGEVVAGDASPLPTGLILEPGATVQDITA